MKRARGDHRTQNPNTAAKKLMRAKAELKRLQAEVSA
jgi:hypothetical protein